MRIVLVAAVLALLMVPAIAQVSGVNAAAGDLAPTVLGDDDLPVLGRERRDRVPDGDLHLAGRGRLGHQRGRPARHAQPGRGRGYAGRRVGRWRGVPRGCGPVQGQAKRA